MERRTLVKKTFSYSNASQLDLRSRGNLRGAETDELVLELSETTKKVVLSLLSELISLELVLLVLHF